MSNGYTEQYKKGFNDAIDSIINYINKNDDYGFETSMIIIYCKKLRMGS